MKRLLSEADRQRIEASVRAIESQSSIEIVVASLARSGDYWQWRVAVSACWALAAALGLLSFTNLSSFWAIVAEAPIGLGTYFILGYPTLHRWLIPRGAAELAVETQALSMFTGRGLHRTRDRTGLLLLVSELEHRVVILGDAGLHERIGDGGWERHVAHVIARIHEGQATAGILEVLDEIAAVARERLPIRADDVNELPDQVIIR